MIANVIDGECALGSQALLHFQVPFLVGGVLNVADRIGNGWRSEGGSGRERIDDLADILAGIESGDESEVGSSGDGLLITGNAGRDRRAYASRGYSTGNYECVFKGRVGVQRGRNRSGEGVGEYADPATNDGVAVS